MVRTVIAPGLLSGETASDKTRLREDEWRKVMLKEERNPMFVDLADSSLPFSAKWEDIFKRLPDVSCSEKRARLPYAYSNPLTEIQSLKSSVRQEGYQDINSECLQRALNFWVNDKGGSATVGHLWDALKLAKLKGAADSFFSDYFTSL